MSCPSRSAIWMFVVVPALLIVPTGERRASAQDFRVATAVAMQAREGARWETVGQSITLFHAGKVYDYMEQVGEVVIFEPTQDQYVLLRFNGTEMATSLQFPQLQQYLKVAQKETESHIRRLEAEGPKSAQRRAALRFQLAPEFDETYDPSTSTLTFLSPLMRYEVETDTTDRPLVVQQYLQYADWAARMNYVLHSGALYPNVRLAVNKSLAERKVLPTEVRKFLDGDQPMRFRAEHKFDWTLTTTDQMIIRKCEKARTADTTNWVNFREYQRTLVSDTRR